MLPRSMVIKLSPARGERFFTIRATISLPVPFSPKIKMLASVSDSLYIVSFNFLTAGDSPMKSEIGDSFPIADTCSRNLLISLFDLLSFIADDSVASSFSFSQGFEMKSVAPAFIALTAFSVSAYAVMNTTTALGSILNICSRYSNPSLPLIASRQKFISRSITSGLKVSMKCFILDG